MLHRFPWLARTTRGVAVSGRFELKVSAAAWATALSSLAVWALQTYVFKGEVPVPVSAAVQVVIPTFVTFAAGYLAKHTPRPDLVAQGDEAAGPEDVGGRHVLDGEATDIPVSQLGTRDLPRHDEQ